MASDDELHVFSEVDIAFHLRPAFRGLLSEAFANNKCFIDVYPFRLNQSMPVSYLSFCAHIHLLRGARVCFNLPLVTSSI